MAKKKKKLTAKQKLFADYWLLTMNGAEAARMAKYSAKTADKIAYENLRKPEIQEYIEKRRKQREELVGISQEKMLKGLVTVFERALEPEVVRGLTGEPVYTTIEEDGKKVRAVLARDNPKAAISAAEQIAKYQGWHAPAKIQEVKENPFEGIARKLFGKNDD